MRDDIFLTNDGDSVAQGDIMVTDTGDILLTNNERSSVGIRQAVLIRLRWFFAEWRFDPRAGFPYFEEVFVKSPNIPKIKGLLRSEVMSVGGVIDVKDIEIKVDNVKRSADASFLVRTAEEIYREELKIDAA